MEIGKVLKVVSSSMQEEVQFLCATQCMLRVPLCKKFISQRTTEGFHREPQRITNIEVNY